MSKRLTTLINPENDDEQIIDSSWALKDGKLIHIDNVVCGLKCECYCPNPKCNSPMVARNKGKKRTPHFAHYRIKACEDYYETVMHLLAKDIIQEQKCIMLPNIEGKPTGLVRLHDIQIEKYDDKYDIQPDAEGIMENGQRLLIEFKVTHPSSQKKIEIVKKNNLLCIEINLDKITTDRAEITELLVGKTERRHWVEKQKPKQVIEISDAQNSVCYNRYYEEMKDYVQSLFEEGKFFIRPISDWRIYKNPFQSRESYRLQNYDYDTCIRDTKHCNFDCGLLLYRNTKQYKGWIAINVIPAERSEKCIYPKDLRLIDIIIPPGKHIEQIKPSWIFRDNDINQPGFGVWVDYINFNIKDRVSYP